MTRLLTATMLSLALCGSARAQHGFWQPDDRVLITSFHLARGIATDQRHVYVATTDGLEIYDQSFRRWLLPSTVEDGYPARERPARVAYDPRERGVWIMTEAGTVYSWTLAMGRWDQRSPFDVPDQIRRDLTRAFDANDPALAVMRNFAGRDASGRTWQVSGLAPGERPGTYWASTYGGNFSFIDSRNLSAEPYAFGSIGRGSSAIAVDDKGNIYFGGDAASRRTGITRADTALQRWQQFESQPGAGPQRRVYDMLSAATGVYAAAGDGLFVQRGNRWQLVADGDVRALAAAGERVWAGTRGSLGYVDATDRFTTIEFPLQTVQALAARGDTLWVGASAGVYLVINGVAHQISSTPDVHAIALTSRQAFLLTRGGLHSWDGASAPVPIRHASLQKIGRPHTIAAIGDHIYVGGEYGVAQWNPTSGSWRHLVVPDDIPEGPIFDVAFENGRLWLATPAGALRLLWK